MSSAVFFHRSFVIKLQWQADSSANEKYKATIRTIKKTLHLKTQVTLFYENRKYVIACNKVLPYFHSEKLKITEMDTSTAF